MCLPNKRGYQCMCPIGLKLQADRYGTDLNHIILFAKLRNKLLSGHRDKSHG